MKNEQLLTLISKMPYEDLIKKVQNIRDVRVDARAAAENKPARKAKPKKDKLEKIFDKMSPEERTKLLEALGES